MTDISLSGAPTSPNYNSNMDSIDPAAIALHPPASTASTLHPHYGMLSSAPSLSPTPSAVAHLSTSSSTVATVDSSLPPKPDRSKHDAIKARYKVLQCKWHDLVADRTKLASDLEAAELKREKLQAEADMLIEQMHELAPGISLAPDYVDLSSSDEDDEHGKSRPYDGYMHASTSSSSAFLGRGSGSTGRYGPHHYSSSQHRRSSVIDDNNVPSSSINYFSGQLFGLNSGLDFDSDMGGGRSLTPSGSVDSKRSSNNNGTNHRKNSIKQVPIKDKNEERQIMLSPEQAKEEEARIEEEQKARQRSKSYNPDNIKVRIGVLPSTFVHPLVHNNNNNSNNTSNRSSKSRSPSTTSDTARPSTSASIGGGDDSNQVNNSSNAASSGNGNERPAKRPRTMSKEKSPIKEQETIKEEEEPNPP